MPFEIGNQHGKRQRVFADAIRKRIVQNPEDLPKVIEAMFIAAQSGDVQAATWLRDSSDGKPQQQVSIDAEGDRPLFQAIKMVIVANNPNEINELAQQHGQVIEGELASPMIDTPRGVVPEQGTGVESLGYPSPKVPTEILEPKVTPQDG